MLPGRKEEQARIEAIADAQLPRMMHFARGKLTVKLCFTVVPTKFEGASAYYAKISTHAYSF